MFAASFCIGRSVHIQQEWHIRKSYAVDDNVAMNVPTTIVTVGMCADNSLMPCKMLAAELLAESLCAVNCQAVLNTISRVKTDYVVVRLNVAPTSVFAILKIGFHTGNSEIIIAAI